MRPVYNHASGGGARPSGVSSAARSRQHHNEKQIANGQATPPHAGTLIPPIRCSSPISTAWLTRLRYPCAAASPLIKPRTPGARLAAVVQPDQLDLLVDDSALYKGAALRSAATFTAADACDCKVPAAIPPLPQAEHGCAAPGNPSSAEVLARAFTLYAQRRLAPAHPIPARAASFAPVASPVRRR